MFLDGRYHFGQTLDTVSQEKLSKILYFRGTGGYPDSVQSESSQLDPTQYFFYMPPVFYGR